MIETPFTMGGSALSVRQAAGQLFLIGIVGSKVTPQMAEQMSSVAPGGILLFKRNIVNESLLQNLTRELQNLSQKNSHVPLAIAIDQEGGPVSRLPLEHVMPSALAVGRTQDSKIAFELGYQIGIHLKKDGVTVNLAPVLDALPTDGRPSFIGERAYGPDASLISEMGLAFSTGLAQSGIVPTCKHFPGTSTSSLDPHLHANIYSPLDSHFLKPFSNFFERSLGAVMLSHELVSLDGLQAPATLSRPLIEHLLRTQNHFQGPILTDDLTMGALAHEGNLAQVSLKALQAGVDLVMVTWGPREQTIAVDAISHAIEQGQLSRQEVQKKLDRIWSLKSSGSLRTPAASSRSLTELGRVILDKNIEASFAMKPRAFWNRLCEGALMVLDSPHDFVSELRRVLGSRILTLKSIPETPSEKWVRPKSLILIEVKNTHDIRNLAKLPRLIQKHTLIVNTSSPGHLIEKNFWSVIEVNYRADELGLALGKKIEKMCSEDRVQGKN